MKLSDLFQTQRGRLLAERLATLESDLSIAKQDVTTLRDQNAHLEAILSDVADIDANLPGNQNQRFFRSVYQQTDATRDLVDSRREALIRVSHGAYALKGDATNIVDAMVDYVWGDNGICPVADDPDDDETQMALEDVWCDTRNRLANRCEELVVAALLDGELWLTADYDPLDGSVLLGFMPPESVAAVQQDRTGRDVIVHSKQGVAGSPLRYFVLNSKTPEQTVKEVGENKWAVSENGHTEEFDGLVMGRTFGRPAGATRGRPKLGPVLDYIDLHDSHLWDTAEYERLRKAFIVDVSAKSIDTPAAAKKLLKDMNLERAPQGPTVSAHNDNVKLSLYQPNIGGGGQDQTERGLRVNIYGTYGMPEHWSGSGADANRATAAAQESLPLKRMRRLQGSFICLFTEILQTMLDLRAVAHTGPKVDPKAWKFSKTEIGGRDKTAGAAVIANITNALATAVAQSFISRELANKVFVDTAREAGFDIPRDLEGVPDEVASGLDALVKRLGNGEDMSQVAMPKDQQQMDNEHDAEMAAPAGRNRRA